MTIFFSFLRGFLIGVGIGLIVKVLTGCSSLPPVTSMSDAWCEQHPEASSQRCVRDHSLNMAQDYLKRYDVGCPTAVFIAPGGNLEQCQETVQGTVGITTYPEGAPKDTFGQPKEAVFDTIDDAAIIALRISYAISPYYEHGGAIIQRPSGKYMIGVPVTAFAGDNMETPMDPALYTDTGKVVAGYHTHPCLKNTHAPQYFSRMDLQTARIAAKPTYIANLCTGEVHAWDPAIDKSDNDFKIGGRIVGKFTVSGEVLDAREPR